MRKFLSNSTLAVVSVGAVLAASVSALGAADIFKARMLTGKGPVEPPMINVQIEVTSWTTPEEIRAFQQTLDLEGTDAFLAAFSRADKGVVRFMSARGFNLPVHAALTVPTEKGKNILLFFNRLQWNSGARQAIGRNFFMVIELKLNEKGKGEGRFYEDARIRLDGGLGRIEMETYESAPKLLPQVQEIVKKAEEKK
jgi:hypothetical protein